MNIRLIQVKDYESAVILCESRGFPFPSADSIVGALIAHDERTVGVGIVRRIYEAIIAVDAHADKNTQAMAFTRLIQEGRFYSELAKIDQWHTFVEDPNIVNTLKSTFGFKDCKGTALILDIHSPSMEGDDSGKTRTEAS